jgi:hypothetical protein
MTIESTIYLLCVLMSCLCAWLLTTAFRRHRDTLLLSSALCFVLLAANNLLVFADLILLPHVDLGLARLLTALTAGVLLLCGIIWGME